MSRITIRPATLLDVDRVCELIVETPGGLADMAGSREGALRMARATFSSRKSFFGYERTLVAEDGDRVVGEMVRVSGLEWVRLRRHTGVAMVAAAPPRDALRLLWRGSAARRAMAPIPEDVLYVVSLCVEAARRGQGIGAVLLAKAIEEARAAELRSVALDVAGVNRSAVRFYAREGFVPVTRGAWGGAGPGVPGPLRMERLTSG